MLKLRTIKEHFRYSDGRHETREIMVVDKYDDEHKLVWSRGIASSGIEAAKTAYRNEELRLAALEMGANMLFQP